MAAVLSTALALPIPGWVRILGALAIVGHGFVRFPAAPPPILIRSGDHRWMLPARGLGPLRLAPGTRYSGWWVRLVLVGEGKRLSVLLLRDQVAPQRWWRLQEGLRRTFVGGDV